MSDDIQDSDLQASQMQLPIMLPRMADSDLAGLFNWVLLKQRQGRYEPLVKWLGGIIGEEIQRRAGEAVEPSMPRVPNWTPGEAGQALLGMFVLAHIGLTPGQSEFVNVLEQHIIVEVASVLEQMDDFCDAYISGELNCV